MRRRAIRSRWLSVSDQYHILCSPGASTEMSAATAGESERRAALVAAECKALKMFDAIEAAELVVPGRTERQVEDDIYALALKQFGVEQHWHRRIVRAGVNTL